jgi:hypothetical protein
MRHATRALALLVTFATVGCGEAFPPPSEVHGIRVLAVRPDPASGVPGATVHLSMLLADSRELDPSYSGVDKPLNVLWFAGCHNPPGRQYFACLPGLEALAQSLSDTSVPPPPEVARLVGAGTEFDVTLPDDILSAAPLIEHDPIHYGVSYVFFVACVGTIAYDPSVKQGLLPVSCTTPEGKLADASGLVVGFTTIYTYEGAINSSPILTSLDFDGEPMAASMATRPEPPCETDEECNATLPRRRRVCTLDTRTCAPVIGACSGSTCPPLRVTPHIDTASVEQFTGGNEIMWASFYASSGAVSAPTRLLVDRESGITGDFSEEWLMPGTPRTSRIWVTVNDQRGGADWAFFDVSVQ